MKELMKLCFDDRQWAFSLHSSLTSDTVELRVIYRDTEARKRIRLSGSSHHDLKLVAKSLIAQARKSEEPKSCQSQ